MAHLALTVHRDGDIAEIALADAPLSAATLAALDHAVEALHDDVSVLTVLLTGSTAFATAMLVGPALDLPFRRLESLGPPVIAVIEGEASGAGLELALACDLRVASSTATFSMPQVAASAVPSLGGTQRLPRIAGRAVANAMILFGSTLSAEEAYGCGLVNALAPAGRERDEAMRIARVIARRGPLAVRYAKESLVRGADMPLDAALRYETDLTVILQTTADRAEGVAAFLEKRPPQFNGR